MILKEGKQFILYQLQYLQEILLKVKIELVLIVNNLYYLTEEKLYLETQLLEELTSFQNIQLKLVLL